MKKSGSHLSQIIKILNDGKYHDDNAVGSKLGITRSAVWKAVKRLESYGVEISSMRARGYKLKDPIQLLDRDYIVSNIGRDKLSLDLFESLDSTNEYLKGVLTEKYPHFCLAERQTLGKGRLGRDWYSPFGQNIYLSCRYLFQKDISGLAGLSLVVALAVINMLKNYLPPDRIKAKWPNDIVFDDKKIAGILIDIQAEANGLSSAIIGIGLNVNMMTDENHQISQAWTSMRKIKGSYFDRKIIVVQLIEALLEYLERFTATGLLNFIQEWEQVDYLLGKKICLRTVEEKKCGEVKGIDQLGQILLELTNGDVKTFSSGDATILGRGSRT